MIEEFSPIPWKCIFSTQVMLDLLDRAAKSSSKAIDTTEDACSEAISIWKAKDKCFSKLNIEGHVGYCWESCHDLYCLGEMQTVKPGMNGEESKSQKNIMRNE